MNIKFNKLSFSIILLLQFVLFTGLYSCTEKMTDDNTDNATVSKTQQVIENQLKSASLVNSQTSVPTIATVTLFAGQTINVGNLVINEADTNADGLNDALAVTYNLTGGWKFNEIHLWVGSSLASMPVNKSGNPVPGSFPYKPADTAGKSTYTVIVPFSAIGYNTCNAVYYVAAHASVSNGTNSQTLWSAGTAINSKGQWATYTKIEVADKTAASITGSIEVVEIEGCSASNAPASLTSVSALEALGLNIADARTTDANLVVTSTDVVTGSCPIVVSRTYTITDGCGNKNSFTQIIHVNDHTPPTAAPLAPVTVQCAGDVPAANIALVSAQDNCSAPVVAFVGDSSNGATCGTVITRTYSVTDACGNSINVTQIINVIDVTAPVLSSPGAPATITAPALPVFTAPTATDNCDQSPVLSFTDVTVTGSTSSTVTRTWSAKDACGNVSATVSQTITINGSTIVTPPVVPPGDGGPTSYTFDTAFGGNASGNGNAWWYYYDGVGVETIWAGQYKNAGTIEKVGGNLIITLANGFELTSDAESVKIQGYSVIPSSRPIAGQFTTYKGTSLTVPVGSFPYYVIHLDVRKAN